MVRESKNAVPDSSIDVRESSVDGSQPRDLATFEQLVRQYQPLAYSLAMRFLGDETEATDVVQDSFIRIWRHMNQYNPKQKFTTWLYRIVANLCIDRTRALKRRRALFFSRDVDPGLEEIADQRDSETTHSNEQLAEIITRLSNHLSRKQRLVFALRDLQDLTVEEVVKITGMSIGSVKTNLYYARKTIRDLLASRFGIVREDI
jgi:RNA polymerase sigma-70 factor (ECF subfamily)